MKSLFDEPFTLRNDSPRPKPATFENVTGRQLRFLSGDNDCLPGQLDLFEHDGLPEKGVARSMKALSVRGYWAWAIAEGHKSIENRTWFVNYRGPLAIHLGTSKAADCDSREFLAALGIETPDELPRGCIIAVVDLVDIVPLDQAGDDPFAEGPFCWIVRNVRKLANPVKCPGKLNIYDVPADVAAQVEVELL